MYEQAGLIKSRHVDKSFMNCEQIDRETSSQKGMCTVHTYMLHRAQGFRRLYSRTDSARGRVVTGHQSRALIRYQLDGIKNGKSSR